MGAFHEEPVGTAATSAAWVLNPSRGLRVRKVAGFCTLSEERIHGRTLMLLRCDANDVDAIVSVAKGAAISLPLLLF